MFKLSRLELIHLAAKVPALLETSKCDELISYFEKNVDRAVRENSTNVYTLDRLETPYQVVHVDVDSPEHKICIDGIASAVSEWYSYLRKFDLFDVSGLFNMTQEVYYYRIMKYTEGTFIHPHVDVGINKRGVLHRGSCTINLSSSTDYTGGEFNLLREENSIDLDKGDALVFPADSFWIHSVSPIKSGVRYSLNAFLGPDKKWIEY